MHCPFKAAREKDGEKIRMKRTTKSEIEAFGYTAKNRSDSDIQMRREREMCLMSLTVMMSCH